MAPLRRKQLLLQRGVGFEFFLLLCSQASRHWRLDKSLVHVGSVVLKAELILNGFKAPLALAFATYLCPWAILPLGWIYWPVGEVQGL